MNGFNLSAKAKVNLNNEGDVNIMKSTEKNESQEITMQDEVNAEQSNNEETNTNQDELSDHVPSTEEPIKIEDIIETGKRGVTNFQMIPAMKKAIAEESLEKLLLLKQSYIDVFNGSIRYLKRGEREFIANNIKD